MVKRMIMMIMKNYYLKVNKKWNGIVKEYNKNGNIECVFEYTNGKSMEMQNDIMITVN